MDEAKILKNMSKHNARRFFEARREDELLYPHREHRHVIQIENDDISIKWLSSFVNDLYGYPPNTINIQTAKKYISDVHIYLTGDTNKVWIFYTTNKEMDDKLEAARKTAINGTGQSSGPRRRSQA